MIINIPPDVQYPDLNVMPVAGSDQSDIVTAGGFSCDFKAFKRILEFNGLSFNDLDDRHIIPIFEGMYSCYRKKHPEYMDPCGEFLSQWEKVRKNPGFTQQGGRA